MNSSRTETMARLLHTDRCPSLSRTLSQSAAMAVALGLLWHASSAHAQDRPTPEAATGAARWAQLNDQGKLLYAAGLLDGALIVRSTLMSPGDAAEHERAIDRRVAPTITPEKLRGGLTTFFGDPRNRNIDLPYAATVVLLTASGATPALIDAAVQGLRNAQPRPGVKPPDVTPGPPK
jgi:hypothetical protein